jgi:hypothetical protein
MVFQRDKSTASDSVETGLPPAQSGEDVPRWLVILGLVASLTLLVALLRYAIDLLGVVFVIILVGFAIRALSDWLTEGESVSGWAMSALSLGLMGTVLVGLWLFNSGDLASGTLQNRLPGPLQRTVAWMESQGWGQRVLLPGSSTAPVLSVRPTDSGAPPSEAPDHRGPVAMTPALPSTPPVQASRAVGAAKRAPSPPPVRRAPAAGEAEAAPSGQAVAPPPPPVAPPSVAVSTSTTLTTSPSRAVVGHSVRLTAVVRAVGADSSPRGSVTFSADGALLGRATVRDGLAMLVTLNLAIGDHVLAAAYEGDGTHEPSQSASISQTVARK